MATEALVKKLKGQLAPVDPSSALVLESLKTNGIYKAVFTQPRNLAFHRKFFGLLDVAFDAWEAPALEHKGVPVMKNRERFRKDLIIQCGHYELSVGLDGRIRCDARSISFANMGQDDFEGLYSTAIDVILGKVLSGYTRDDLDMLVNKILGFA